ncbi:MAG: C25 family cysteine peptidase [Bacteroidales bacterium]|nr:C25 family cysteine peptidase [Bacteroidales bacterium]
MKRFTMQILAIIFFATGLFFSLHVQAQSLAIDFNRQADEVQVGTDNMKQLDATFTLKGLNSLNIETDRGLFNELYLPGAYSVGTLGTPKLPAFKKLIEIPFGAEVSVKVKSFSVTEYQLAEYGLTSPIMPVQPSLRKDQEVSDVPFEFDAKIYQKDHFISPELASVEVLGVLRGYRIARVTVAPVNYNPVKGIIRVYNDIEVEVTFDNVDQALTEYVKTSTYSPYFDVVHQSLLNTLGGGGYPAHPDLTKYPVKYLIVAPRMFENDLQSFIEWKTMKGFEVIVGYTDVIGTTYSAIQTWIHAQYNAGTPTDPAPSFVLLVGDTPQVPATMGSSSSKMTDLYYASVDGDYFPEMYYGRFSATNSAQLLTQIAKTLYYEKYEFTDPGYLNDITLIAGADGTWNPRVGQPTIHYGTENYFNAAHGFVNINTYLTSPYTGCYSAEKIAVSMINYTAHCNETSWGDPNLSQSAVNAFANNGKYPVAVGNCCLAADFGYTECIGETWQRGVNKGSVAYIGSSPSSYWFEDFYWVVGAFPLQGNNNGYVPTFAETTWGSYDAPFNGDYVTTGGTVLVGNLAVTEVHIQNYPSHSSPTYYWQAYNVLGDPSLVPFYTEGADNTVSHMPILPIGMETYEVTAEPGSYIGISKDGVLHGSALVDETGVVEVPLTPVLSGGPVDIVVTKPQYKPYMMQVPAAALEGPYIVLGGYTINDASGNNNGLADYDENIMLNMTLSNVGSDPAVNVMATITGTDEYVTLTGSATQTFGSIAAGEAIVVNNAFSFSIDSFVPDQYKAQFVLEITDGNDTWTSNLFITIQAPVVKIAEDFVIDDSQGGNGDGILDPGETGLVKLNVSNTGHSAISNINIAIASSDPLLVINSQNLNVASLEAGASAQIAINVTADASAPIGWPVNVDLDATAGPSGLYTAEQTIMVVIGLIPEYLMSNETVTTCVGLFYDSGGPNGQYGSSQDFVMTFLPATPDAIIKAEFLSFETENNYDFLYVYNGNSTSAPQISGSPFSGTSGPGTVVGLNSTGALTFKFHSDGSVTKAGWEAAISCHNISGTPECASDPQPADGATNVGIASTLQWASFDAVEFDVYFGLTANPGFVETVGNNSYQPTMQANTTYYWKVIPKNANGQAEDCPVWSFTTGGPEYLMSNGSVTVTNGMFYDSGGPSAPYSSNENYTMAFTPAVQGQHLEFVFTAFEIENNYDKLRAYNGPTASAPEFAGSPFTGTTSPGTLTSTHESGAITFVFTSDYSVTKAGWVANFESKGVLTCTVSATPEEICAGESSMLQAIVSGGTGTYECTWSPAASLNDPSAMNPIATPDVTTTYTVTIDDGENIVTDQVTVTVFELPAVDLGDDITVCANHTAVIDGTTAGAVSYLWTPGGYTTPVIEVDTTGVGIGTITFNLKVTNANDCVGEDDITVIFDPCVNLDELGNTFRLVVYPNPASTVLNINITGAATTVRFKLLNYQGSAVYNDVIGKLSGFATQQLDISGYAAGIYYLRVETDQNVTIRKVVIK